MSNQNLLLQDDPFAPAAPDSLEYLPSHHCAPVPEDRRILQADGKHPAPCARFCESNAYEIEIRMLQRQVAETAKGNAMYEHVRTLNPRDFADMWTENVCGGMPFDDLVLADMEKRKEQK